MSGFAFKRKDSEKTIELFFSGKLDNDRLLPSLETHSKNEVVIELEGLELINSVGIRGWINWTREFAPARLKLRNCPKIFVDQINLVAGFLPADAVVESFFVPYYCEEENLESFVKWVKGVHYGDGKVLKVPDIWTDGRHSFELDIDPVRYLSFVKRFG